MSDSNDKLKIAADVPSMGAVIDAVMQAQAMLATYIEPADHPRDADATLKKLPAILDDGKVVRAVDTLLLTD
jgi:hypothetical protein